jgi:hypothetical protein
MVVEAAANAPGHPEGQGVRPREKRIVAIPVTANQNLETGKSTPLFETSLPFPDPPGGPAFFYDVTADGQRFLLTVPPASAPIIVVLDWAAGLKRQ